MSEQDALKIHEAQRNAELARGDKTLAPVSLAMAILAVAVGSLSMLGQRAHNGVLLAQTRANFQKVELAGDRTRAHSDAVLLTMLDVLALTDPTRAVALKEEFKTESKNYGNQEAQDLAEVRRLEIAGQRDQQKADRFNLGQLFCELALVLSSITLLTRDRRFWFVGTLAGAVGLLVAFTTVLVR